MEVDVLDDMSSLGVASMEVKVPSTEVLGGHQVFVIQVVVFSEQWTLRKRYSQFEKLYQSVLVHSPQDLKGVHFPPKSAAPSFLWQIGADELETRRVGLNGFLSHLCRAARRNLPPSWRPEESQGRSGRELCLWGSVLEVFFVDR